MPRRWILIIGTITIFAIVAWMSTYILANDPPPWDVRVTQSLQANGEIWLPYLMALVSLVGYAPWGLILVIVTGLVLWCLVNLRTGIYFMIIGAAQGVINMLLKNVIMRPRPSEPLARVMLPAEGYSFPSGHVMFYVVCFGLLIYLILLYSNPSTRRNIGIAILIIHILLVGVSRIYLGAHWLSDVIAAYLIGAILLAWPIAVYEIPSLDLKHRDQPK